MHVNIPTKKKEGREIREREREREGERTVLGTTVKSAAAKILSGPSNDSLKVS